MWHNQCIIVYIRHEADALLDLLHNSLPAVLCFSGNVVQMPYEASEHHKTNMTKLGVMLYLYAEVIILFSL